MTYFIQDLEQKMSVSKRQIYNLIRRREFYLRFSVESMTELPSKTNNGTPSKVLTQEQYDAQVEQLRG